MPAARISSMIMRKAVLVAPSRSTSVCKGSVRWFFPAAVMMAFLISTASGIVGARSVAEARARVNTAAQVVCASVRSVHFRPRPRSGRPLNGGIEDEDEDEEEENCAFGRSYIFAFLQQV